MFTVNYKSRAQIIYLTGNLTTQYNVYICPPKRYRGREARLSSAKAATAVRIRSIPQQKLRLFRGFSFLIKVRFYLVDQSKGMPVPDLIDLLCCRHLEEIIIHKPRWLNVNITFMNVILDIGA